MLQSAAFELCSGVFQVEDSCAYHISSALRSGACEDTGFPWNVLGLALDLALSAYLFEAAGSVYPANQNLGHVACRII